MPASIVKRLAIHVASVAGIGFVPVMPGTMASAVTGLVLYLAFGAGWSVPAGWYLGGVLALALASIPVIQCATGGLGDPSWVVLDEVAGMLLATAGLVLPGALVLGWHVLLAFIFFRLFDITKWCGVGALEKLPGAWGVMADDLLAGLWAWGCVTGVAWVWHSW